MEILTMPEEWNNPAGKWLQNNLSYESLQTYKLLREEQSINDILETRENDREAELSDQEVDEVLTELYEDKVDRQIDDLRMNNV